MKLVWLFEEHRNAVKRLSEAETSAAILTDRNLRLEADNTRLVDNLSKMQDYVSHITDQSPIDLFERYQKQVLQDEPYADGKIPDSEWLTPGDTEPVTNA